MARASFGPQNDTWKLATGNNEPPNESYNSYDDEADNDDE